MAPHDVGSYSSQQFQLLLGQYGHYRVTELEWLNVAQETLGERDGKKERRVRRFNSAMYPSPSETGHACEASTCDRGGSTCIKRAGTVYWEETIRILCSLRRAAITVRISSTLRKRNG